MSASASALLSPTTSSSLTPTPAEGDPTPLHVPAARPKTPHRAPQTRQTRKATSKARPPARVPRVPATVRRALRAELVGVGLSVRAAAQHLGVHRDTLDALLMGRQHVCSRLGYAAWPDRVRALCAQMRAAHTILARHLDAAAREIAAARLPLPELIGGPGLGRLGRRDQRIGPRVKASGGAASARKRAS